MSLLESDIRDLLYRPERFVMVAAFIVVALFLVTRLPLFRLRLFDLLELPRIARLAFVVFLFFFFCLTFYGFSNPPLGSYLLTRYLAFSFGAFILSVLVGFVTHENKSDTVEKEIEKILRDNDSQRGRPTS